MPTFATAAAQKTIAVLRASTRAPRCLYGYAALNRRSWSSNSFCIAALRSPQTPAASPEADVTVALCASNSQDPWPGGHLSFSMLERVAVWTSTTSALPEKLAAHEVLNFDPSRLTFALVASEQFKGLRDLCNRLDCLFPGCGIAAATLNRGECVCTPHGQSPSSLVAAAVVDADRAAVARVVSAIAPTKFRANQPIAQDLFVRRASENDFVSAPPRSDKTYTDLPVLSMKNAVVFPQQQAEFYVVESRHKYMIKWCLETRSPFLLADLTDPTRVSTICELVEVDYAPVLNGEARILVKGVARSRCGNDEAAITPPARHEFGLQRVRNVRIVSDTVPSKDELPPCCEASVSKLRDYVHELFRVNLGEVTAASGIALEHLRLRPPLSDDDPVFWERLTWFLASWIHPHVPLNRKLAWLSSTSTRDRLHAILDALEVLVNRVRANQEHGRPREQPCPLTWTHRRRSPRPSIGEDNTPSTTRG